MKFSYFTWAVLSAMALASCSDSNDEGEDNNFGPQGSGSMEQMTPEQSKTYLQNTVQELIDKFNPEDQRQAIELAGYFCETYGDLEMPSNFSGRASRSCNPNGYFRSLALAADGNVNALSRSAYYFTYNINFNELKGIYEPDFRHDSWKKTADSDDLVFRFTNRQGQTAELKVTQSGGTSEFDFETYDEWYGYDPSTGNYEDMEEYSHYYLSIPKKITATVTSNGQQLASSVVNSNINVNGHVVYADAEATVLNLKAVGKINGTDTKVEETSEVYVNNEKIASTYATVLGNSLCNPDKYEQMSEMDDEELADALARMFSKGDCGVNLLDKVQVYGQVDYYRQLPADCEDFSIYDYDSKSEGREACQEACNRLNQHIKSQLRYNNTATDQATLLFTPSLFEQTSYYWSYWEYIPSPMLLFPDGTTYEVEEYLSKFALISGKFDSLIDSYLRIWRQAQR